MRKVFIIDGGAGRVICAIPALEEYVKTHPEEDVKILIAGWDSLFWGNKLLQNKTFNINDKGTFDNILKDADEVVSPEPYKLPGYYNQKYSLIEAFDVIINGKNNNLKSINLQTSIQEKIEAANVIIDVRKHQNKEKTIVIQPFGSAARFLDFGVDHDVIDETNRSLTLLSYSMLVRELSKDYNIILFANNQFHFKEDVFTYKLNADLRTHMSVISAADYFIGCDSVGQHMARSFNKPGTVFVGSTFPQNITYMDWFQIIDKICGERVYSPMRINHTDSNMADRLNEGCMFYTVEEMEDIISNIKEHIKISIGSSGPISNQNTCNNCESCN